MTRTAWVTHSLTAVAAGSLVWFFTPSPRESLDHEGGPEAPAPARSQVARGPTAGTQSELDRALGEIEALQDALSAAQAENLQLRDGLRDDALIARAQGISIPKGYDSESYLSPATARLIYEAEPMELDWATPAEAEIYQFLAEGPLREGLPLAAQEVQCRSETCRILLTYSDGPESGTELNQLYANMVRIMGEFTNESAFIGGATIGFRVGYPGELATNEIFLFRSGNQVVPSFDVAQEFPKTVGANIALD